MCLCLTYFIEHSALIHIVACSRLSSFLWLSNILLGRTDAEAPVVWPPDAKN